MAPFTALELVSLPDTEGSALAHPTSFISLSDLHLPDIGASLHLPKGLLPRSTFAGLLSNYQWFHDHVWGPTPAQMGQSRIVEYLHAGSPDKKHLDAVWWQAVKQWLAQPRDIANRTTWQQKVCVSNNGTFGADNAECAYQGIVSRDVKNYPVVRFFPAGSASGEDYPGEMAPEQLVHYAQSMSNFDASERDATTEGEDVGFKVVDYYAAACPHCQKMKPAWTEATDKWNKEIETGDPQVPHVAWQQKECFDKDWHPGRDYDECSKQHIRQFPTVKFTTVGSNGVEKTTEYSGPRTADGFLGFARDGAGVKEDHVKEVAVAAAGAQDADKHEGASSDAAQGGQEERFKVGDLVEGMYKDQAWVAARIRDVNPDGTYNVAWTDGDTEDTLKHANELHRADFNEEEYEAELAKAGYDYSFVNYYAAAGQRSRRLAGIVARVMKGWINLTDPDDDAMFIASLKNADKKRGIEYGGNERTDPPFVWFEQRECYDKNWKPGSDFEMCRKNGVDKLPSLRLYAFDDKTGAFSKEGVEFHGPRTPKGILDFLTKQTDWDKIKDNILRFNQAVLGSEGAAPPHGSPEAPTVAHLPAHPVVSEDANAAPEDMGALDYVRKGLNVISGDFFGHPAGEDAKGGAPQPSGAEVVSPEKNLQAAAAAAATMNKGDAANASGPADASAIVAATKNAAIPLPLLVGLPPPHRLLVQQRQASTAASFL